MRIAEVGKPSRHGECYHLMVVLRLRRHEQLAVEHFVPIAVVGQSLELRARPSPRFCRHEHTLISLGRGKKEKTIPRKCPRHSRDRSEEHTSELQSPCNL